MISVLRRLNLSHQFHKYTFLNNNHVVVLEHKFLFFKWKKIYISNQEELRNMWGWTYNSRMVTDGDLLRVLDERVVYEKAGKLLKK